MHEELPLVGEKVPPEHAVHVNDETAMTAVEYKPAMQSVHTDAPTFAEKVPCGQLAQVKIPFKYVPTGQPMAQAMAPIAETSPASQPVHNVAPVKAEEVPAAQPVQLEAPEAEYNPPPHNVQPDAAEFEYAPASHVKQLVAIASEKVPA
jgi:hypothetical protein